jgi:general secretion pathway protein I
MICRSSQPVRNGLTLLEVLLATAVFALSLVALGQLINHASDRALEVQERGRGARLAQTKLAEYVAGVRSLQGGGTSGDFEDEGEPDWKYEATVEADGSAAGLYRVTVTVSRNDIRTTLSQFVFDPKLRGTIQGAQTPTTASPTTDPGSTTNQSTTTTNPGASTNTGSGAGGGGGGTSGGGGAGGGGGNGQRGNNR